MSLHTIDRYQFQCWLGLFFSLCWSSRQYQQIRYFRHHSFLFLLFTIRSISTIHPAGISLYAPRCSLPTFSRFPHSSSSIIRFHWSFREVLTFFRHIFEPTTISSFESARQFLGSPLCPSLSKTAWMKVARPAFWMTKALNFPLSIFY